MEVFDAPINYAGPLPLPELAYWVAFSRVTGIGPKRFKLLLDFFLQDANAAWNASENDLLQAGLEPKIAANVLAQRASINPQQELVRLERYRVSVVTWSDPAYPAALKDFDYAPPVLYIAGSISDADAFALAVVGTRKLSAYGRQVTEQFVSELVANNVTIISGLAQGIDTIAHTAALDAGGRTIAVLACGLDTIYPPQNTKLAQRIVESGQGALVSEFPIGVKPDSRYFPIRNRIISGLSRGVLVTEAPARSGALITANFALQQDREVFAVPGNIFAATSEGVNKLIQEGIHPVTSARDILEILGFHSHTQSNFAYPPAGDTSSPSKNPGSAAIKRAAQPAKAAPQPETEDERALLALLDSNPRHIDEIIRATALPTTTVASTLMMMELKGMIRQVGAMHYTVAM